MELIYFKDTFIPKDKALIPIDDRSYRFGDGLFETILVYNGKIYNAAHHVERLKNGLEFFKIALPVPDLTEICTKLIQENAVKEGYIRILVSRGINGPDAIGYAPKDTEPYIIVQTIETPFPEFRKISLWVSNNRASMHLKSKVNSAMLYVMAMQEAAEHHCDNALILDSTDRLCETASGNIFWFKNNTLYTPSLDLPFVPGTIRKKIISLSPYKVQEGHFSLSELQRAEEVFMTNIGLLVASVNKISPLGFTSEETDVTRTLRKLLEESIKEHCQ